MDDKKKKKWKKRFIIFSSVCILCLLSVRIQLYYEKPNNNETEEENYEKPNSNETEEENHEKPNSNETEEENHEKPNNNETEEENEYYSMYLVGDIDFDVYLNNELCYYLHHRGDGFQDIKQEDDFMIRYLGVWDYMPVMMLRFKNADYI